MSELYTLPLLTGTPPYMYYRLEDNANDYESHYNGTWSNFTTGIFGKAMLFNGANCMYLTAGTATTDVGTFSVSAHISLATLNTAQAIMCDNYFNDGGSNVRGWVFRVNASNQLEFAYGTGTARQTKTDTTAVISDSLHHHVGFWFNSSNVTFYLDGVKKSTIGVGSITWWTGVTPVQVGSEYSPSNTNYFTNNSWIDDLAWWNSQLSDQNMADLSLIPDDVMQGAFFKDPACIQQLRYNRRYQALGF